jgi:hypothetical protein
MDYKFWIPLCVSLASLYFSHRQIQLQMTAIQDRRKLVKPTGLKLYWPMLTMAALVALAWLPYVVAKPDPFAHVNVTTPVLQGWGGGDPRQCNATVNTASLMPYANSHRFVLVCGVGSTMVDRYEDTRIIVSPAFKILTGTIPVSIPYSEAFIETMRVELGRAGIPLRSQEEMDASQAGPAVGVWHDVVIIPNSVDPSDIRRISDVTRLGGKFTGPPGYHRRIVLTRDPPNASSSRPPS